MSCETILFHAALFVPSYLHFSNRAQRSYLWWQAKRKFYSRSHDSPLFAVESSMNLTYHSTLQWTICVYLKPFISRFSHATLHRTICVWLKPFVNVWVNSYFTKSIMHQSIPAAPSPPPPSPHPWATGVYLFVEGRGYHVEGIIFFNFFYCCCLIKLARGHSNSLKSKEPSPFLWR